MFKDSKRLWIFHRGVGVANASGVLFMQKLDALLMGAFGRCCGKKKKEEAKKEEAQAVKPKVPGVERISISSIVKKHGWKTLFKSQTIQEATFKEVFLVYRINHLRDPEMGSGNTRGIYIKSFRDIPHSDLEGESHKYVFLCFSFLNLPPPQCAIRAKSRLCGLWTWSSKRAARRFCVVLTKCFFLELGFTMRLFFVFVLT